MNRSLPLLLAVALVAGCGKDEPAPAADTPAPAAEPAAAAPAAPAEAPAPPPDAMRPFELPEPVIDTTPVDTTISTIDGSNAANDAVTELTGPIGDEFKPTDTVYFALHTNGTAEKYTISSKWFYPDGQVIAENSQIVNGAGPTTPIFNMSKPDGWAAGEYKVEFSINGKLQQTKTFVVR